MQQSTLKKLSEVLGISISTVSRALKNHPDISEHTKTRVRELATAMEYEPNSYAVQLRTRQSNVMGILVPSINNFFYDSFIAAVEEEARQQGYSVLIMQSRDQLEIENANLHLFRKNMVSGVFASVSIETEDMAAFHRLRDMKIPVIFFDRVPELPDYFKVCLPDARAARLAAEVILQKKKKKVLGLFGHPHLSITKMRAASFRETLEQNVPAPELSIDYPEGIEKSREVALAALKGEDKPDVIFCMGDLILVGTMHAIHELQLDVPGDISVISISNGLFPTMYHPKITYVETNGAKLGKLAFSRMMSALRKEPFPEVSFLEAELMEGGSI
ncbi:MAG: LacI family DNA-binding transcriptional regulator [Sphingobacteriales bacterium]|nr:LacI family DNA-binding transcriptional regulator [Sphingobacteriales bacterium]